MEIFTSEFLKIHIKTSGLFFEQERIESLFNSLQYMTRLISTGLKDENGQMKYDVLYEFKKTLPGIREMNISKNELEIVIDNFEYNDSLNVIRKFFDKKEDVDFLYFISDISCSCIRNYCAPTYRDLYNSKEIRSLNRIEELYSSEFEKTLTSKSEEENYYCMITRKLFRCQSYYFDYADSVFFKNQIDVASKKSGLIKSADELIDVVNNLLDVSILTY